MRPISVCLYQFLVELGAPDWVLEALLPSGEQWWPYRPAWRPSVDEDEDDE